MVKNMTRVLAVALALTAPLAAQTLSDAFARMDRTAPG